MVFVNMRKKATNCTNGNHGQNFEYVGVARVTVWLTSGTTLNDMGYIGHSPGRKFRRKKAMNCTNGNHGQNMSEPMSGTPMDDMADIDHSLS